MQLWKSKAFYLSAATLMLFSSTAVAAKCRTASLEEQGHLERISQYTFETVGTLLTEKHIRLTKLDRVTPSLNTQVRDGMHITIERAKTIRFIDGGEVSHVATFAKTVGEFIHQERIRVGTMDKVDQSLQSTIQDDGLIRIRRYHQTVEKTSHRLPFQTIRQQTDRLYVGQKQLLMRGVEGEEQTTVTSIYMDNHRIRRTVSKRIVRDVVNEVIEVGTRQKPVEITYHPDSHPVLTSRSESAPQGIRRQLTVYATAYVGNGGRTATGCAAEPGVIAVDPNVIPLGSKVYIPGVGTVTAADTGGAIVGNRIDICVASLADAYAWGGRTVTVYVLGK